MDKLSAEQRHATMAAIRIKLEAGYIVSHIIADTIAKGLIKTSNPDSDSRKFVSYVPFYA